MPKTEYAGHLLDSVEERYTFSVVMMPTRHEDSCGIVEMIDRCVLISSDQNSVRNPSDPRPVFLDASNAIRNDAAHQVRHQSFLAGIFDSDRYSEAVGGYDEIVKGVVANDTVVIDPLDLRIL